MAVSGGRIVLLTGPSGSGKSRLAARLNAAHGWPIVRLDNFYRDGDDPGLPRSAGLGIVDWDDPASWRADDAITALVDLLDRGTTQCPVYDLSQSRAVGTEVVTCTPTDLIVAEGIFAAHLARPLRERGLLRDAYVMTGPRTVTFVRRLIRDLHERRKPPLVLLRRGLHLLRDEPRVVARAMAAGAECASAREIETACR